MQRSLIQALSLVLLFAGLSPAQNQKPSREQKVRSDRAKVEAEGFWIYNDLPRGIAEAKKTGKPLLVIMRCIPCEECVKLDDDLVNQDPRVRPLLDKFVCVRIVSTNGLDLSLFQYDYDQSFAAFMLNADGTIYGRFGTRSHRTYWSDDVSVEGLGQALRGTLELHEQYPKNKDVLAAKRGPVPEFQSPEKYPTLRDKYGPKLNYEGNVVQSCIHCHQIGDAQRQLSRERQKLVPEEVLFPYPHPKALGLVLDPKSRATVERVEKDTIAAQAGFQKSDSILTLEGQPILSLADVQWVLNQASPQGASLKAEVQRGTQKQSLTLKLPKGWRQQNDISWRSSTWGLRRMATGGMLLEELPAEERNKLGVPATGMALRAKHVGQFGPHAAAKQAGFLQGDVLVAFDGKSNFKRETDLIAYSLTTHASGDKVEVSIIRDGKKLNLTLPMQN